MSNIDVKGHFINAQKVLEEFLADEENFQKIKRAGDKMVESINQGGKIISCGNGGSMCDAMHFAEELTGRYRGNRVPLPAISISDPSYLTCVGNDYGFDDVFSRFLEGVGKKGDVLLGISTSGNSRNVIKAVELAKKMGIVSVCLTGKDGGELARLADIEVRSPKSDFADRAQELHIKIIHSLIDYIEQSIT